MGKSVATPPIPDYTAIAKEQGQQNLTAAQQSSRLSNPNMYTPFGTQTVTYSDPTFDQTRFDADQASYNAKVNRDQFYEVDNGYYGGEGGGWAGSGETYFNDQAYQRALANAGAAPDRNSYMSGGGVPTITQTLTPEAQSTLNAQMRVQRALAGLGEQGVATAQNVMSTPFNPNLPAMQMNVPSAGNVQSGLTADQYGAARANTQAGTYGTASANTRPETYGLAEANVRGDTYGLARGEVPLQYSLDTSNLAAMPINAGTNAQNLILQRLQPTLDQGDASFRQSLANQGLAPGTRAYDTAFRNREMSKNDLYNQAALQGINLDMSARQQGLNEQNTLGTFANQAQLAGAGLYNQALAQNFGQGVTANELLNRSRAQNFAQGSAADQARNQAIAQNFGQGVTADQLYNQSVLQNFNQGLNAQQANNAAQQQLYGQNLSGAQFSNAAIQQSLAQQAALRSQPLNEIIGLMGGSQIQLPQFAGYQSSQVAPPPTFASAQAGYNAALGAANAQNAANSQLTQGLFSLGGAALMAPTGTFSDRRLKTNIKQIGTADNGLNVYSYNYVWGGPTQLGYMADEVEKLIPEAVGESHGYKTVNYGMI